MKEKWKCIKKLSYGGIIYYVSNFGNIKSLYNGKIHYKKFNKNYEGYLSVKIKGKRYRVHRLVYEHFGSGFTTGYHVHHKDKDKTNNRIDNLECLSPSEHNREHHKDNSFHRCKRGHPLTDEEKNCIKNKYKPYYYTIPMLSNEYNVSKSTIKRILKS